jgi:DNA-binding transcriptional LysR family regulator
MGVKYGHALRSMVKTVAPEITLTFDTSSRPHNLEARLRDGDIHMAIDWLPIGSDWCVNEKVFEGKAMVVTRERHPRINAASTLDDFANAEQVCLHPRIELEDQPPGLRELHGLPWRVGFWVNGLYEELTVVLSSDMFCVFPESATREFCNGRGYQVFPLPAELPPVGVLLLWNAQYRRDGGHASLRQLLKAAVTTVTLGQIEAPPPLQEAP